MAEAATIPSRSEIAQEHRWNAESVFETQADWEAAVEELSGMVNEADEYKGHLSDGPEKVLGWFDLYSDIYRKLGKVYVYGAMSYSVDTTDQEAAAMADRAQGLMGQMMAATAFVEPELLAIGRETLEQWMEEEPELKLYEHYFDDLFRQQAHVRSADVEEVMGLVQDPLGTINTTFNTLVNADMTFRPAQTSSGEEREVGQGMISKYLSSPDRTLRRTAWESYADSYLALENTLASNLAATIKADVFRARVRRYDSALEAALFPNNIPTEVFYNLIETFQKNLPTWHRYWAVRRKALGVDELHTYDIWAPLSDEDPEVLFEKGIDWISEGLEPLGDEYVSTLQQGALQDRWIDLYPNKGKRQGAFSFGWPGTYPFIMSSYTNNFRSMSTIAHELGHSMHSYYTWETQPTIYARYPIFLAEVASNFNQAMVRAYMLAHTDDPKVQMAIIEEAMSNFHRYFFIMPTLARWELDMHQRAEKGQALTASVMNTRMAELFGEGYGGELIYEEEREGITWAQFQHMYMNFYVFQYATGISAAHALAQRVQDGEPGAVEDYLDFLKSGSSAYPLETLERAGVDMTSPDPVEAAFEVMAGYVDRLEELTSK